MDAKLIAVFLALLGSVSVIYNQTQTTSGLSEFQAWKLKFGIKYESQFEEMYRERIFMENLAAIELHNLNKLNTYTMRINQFSAMTQEQFVDTYLGTVVPTESIIQEQPKQKLVDIEDIDWVAKGAVTPIKDQGKCGSCWAFSTTGGIEGLKQVTEGSLESFSEQQLVDCSSQYGNNGCNGGLMDNAFRYIKAKGIVHEDEYTAYSAKQHFCSKKKIVDGYKISGYTDIKQCSDLITSLEGRPISVAVDASNWQHYGGEVFTNCQTQLNHGVLLVGLNKQKGAYVVKNSWGTSWGVNGFIYLGGAGQNANTCGICNVASYPNKL